ncbi:MAG: hypothetical protein LBL74_03890 [Bacteroidales bacterium]|nr:hypothetical protein [Bacteroidales bacterium]
MKGCFARMKQPFIFTKGCFRKMKQPNIRRISLFEKIYYLCTLINAFFIKPNIDLYPCIRRNIRLYPYNIYEL